MVRMSRPVPERHRPVSPAPCPMAPKLRREDDGMWINRLAGATVALLMLGSCGGAQTTIGGSSRTASDPHEVSGAVFNVGYDRIAEVYLNPIDMGVLAVDGLDGLTVIDERLDTDRRGDMVVLAVNDMVVGSYPAAGPWDAFGWATITQSVIEDGRRVSPELAAATAEDIYTAVFDAIVADLDEYSRYVDAESAERERATRDGYGGIGLLLQLNEESGLGMVEEVFPEGPAFRAGIRAGDAFLAVNGESAADWELEELARRLRGPINTLVIVDVRRTDGVERRFEIRREQVIINSVSTRYEGDIAIIRVSRFNAATVEHFAEALISVRTRLGADLDGVVLDLRGNPGGLLGQAVAVADAFISRGTIITTRGRHPDSYQSYGATSTDQMENVPLVVLVDGRSASGAEVVAAALQDTRRAVVVGASSFGKGSVQTVTRLPNGGELFLTWSRIYSPSGITIHRQGVMPTICTSAGIEDATTLVTMLRQGTLDIPANQTDLRQVAADDPEALAQLRETCPWRDHDEELEVDVALRLINDASLYSQALNAVTVPTVAQR